MRLSGKLTLLVMALLFLSMSGAVVYACSVISLYSNDNWVWDLTDKGAVSCGGSDSFDYDCPFDEYFKLKVNGDTYCGELDTSNELDYGFVAWFTEETVTDVTVTRQVYVPYEYDFARFVNCIYNGTEASVFRTVKMGGRLDSCDAMFVGSSGNYYNNGEVQFDDEWFAFFQGEDYPIAGALFDGAGGLIAGQASYYSGDKYPDTEWEISLEPGETCYIVWFGLQAHCMKDYRAMVALLQERPEIAFQEYEACGFDPGMVCNWNVSDTDEDGLLDQYEGTHGIDDPEADDDGDGLSNEFELEIGTDPSKADTDGDGLDDFEEYEIFETDPLDADTDNDGLNDGAELDLGTDPNDPDTDGDLIPDGKEVMDDTDPLEAELNEDYDAFVSPEGDDEFGDGTNLNPYYSLDRALEDHPEFGQIQKTLNNGDGTFCIYLGPGEHELDEDVEFGWLSNLMIRGAGIQLTEIDGDCCYGIYAGELDNFELSHMTFDGCSTVFACEGYAVTGEINFHDLRVYTDGCDCSCNDYQGIFFYVDGNAVGGNVFNFSNITFADPISHAITVQKGSGEPSGVDTINVNGVNVCHDFRYALYFQGDDYFDVNVDNCRIGVTRRPLKAKYVNNVSVTDSLFEFTYGGVKVDGCGDCFVENTICMGSMETSWNVYEFQNFWFRNNTVVNSWDYGIDLYTESSYDDVEINNNLFAWIYNSGVGYYLDGDDITATEADFNAFFDVDGDYYDYEKALFADVIEQDPLLTQAGNGVYTPQAGSPLLGAGDNADGVDGTFDDNIGSNNNGTPLAGGQADPGTGTVTITDSDPDSPTFGTGIQINLADVLSGGAVSIRKLTDEERAALLEEFPLGAALGDIIDISVAATFVDEAGRVLIFLRIPDDLDGASLNDLIIRHFDAAAGKWRRLSHTVVFEDLGLIAAEFDPTQGFSPFVVAEAPETPPARRSGGSADLGFLLLILAGGTIALRRRM